jgi:hypothetical protein
MSIIDVRDPSNPVEVGLLYLPDYVGDVSFDGNLAYFSVYQNELFIYDISDPSDPALVSRCNTPGYMRKTLPWGDYVYVADNTSLVILRQSLTATGPGLEAPVRFSLSANHPNPFNSSTIIQYVLPEASEVTIEVYDILGRRVETLAQEAQQAGYHQVTWDAQGCSSGLYFCRIQAEGNIQTKKMLLLK